MDLVQKATAEPALTGVLVLGAVLLMSLAGGLVRGLVLAFVLRRLFRIALPLSLFAGGLMWVRHLLG